MIEARLHDTLVRYCLAVQTIPPQPFPTDHRYNAVRDLCGWVQVVHDEYAEKSDIEVLEALLGPLGLCHVNGIHDGPIAREGTQIGNHLCRSARKIGFHDWTDNEILQHWEVIGAVLDRILSEADYPPPMTDGSLRQEFDLLDAVSYLKLLQQQVRPHEEEADFRHSPSVLDIWSDLSGRGSPNHKDLHDESSSRRRPTAQFDQVPAVRV